MNLHSTAGSAVSPSQVVVVGRSAAHLASARQRLGDTVAIEKVDLYV
jgi:hypothetical protein